MKTIRFRFLTLAIFTGLATVNAQQIDTASYPYSLQQCVDYALQHNVAVQNVILDQTAASEKVKETDGIGLPQINSTAQIQHFVEIPTTVIPGGGLFGGMPGTYQKIQLGTSDNASLGFTATQLLFNGSYFVGLKAAKTYEELAQKNVDRTKTETSAEVTKAYYTVLVNNEKKKLLDANLERVKKLVDDTKAFNQNGFVEKIDVDRITVTYNNLKTEVENINRLLDLSIVLLKYQMGMDQSAKLTLTDKIDNINFQMEVPASGTFAYKNRIEYQLYDIDLTGKRLLLKSDRMGYLPSIALFGNMSTNCYRSKFDFFAAHTPWYPIGIVGLQVNIPIFDGLQRHYRIQQDEIGVLKAQNNLVFIEQTIDMQQAVAKANLQNSSASLQSQKDNMALAQDVFESAQKKYDQGVGSNLEVVNAQTALKEAQTNYFNALYDALIAKVDYDKSVGAFK
jgi:outer membrane protein TolC